MLKHDTLLRSKLQYSFTEQPQLHTSLMVHLTILSPTTSQVIIAQLCLAMADLILLMPEWSTALPELIIMTALSTSNSIPLLEVLLLLPEEADSRHLRLGANRRQQVKEMLLPPITQFLATGQDQKKVITVKCYSSCMTLGAISLDTAVLSSPLMGLRAPSPPPPLPNTEQRCQ